MAGRLTRVAIKNYKSIASCDVELQPLTLLVGPNGSGKSNFLDALRFVAKSAQGSLDAALDPGLIAHLRRPSEVQLESEFRVAVEFEAESQTGRYSLAIGMDSYRGGVVVEEECRVNGQWFHFRNGQVSWSLQSGLVFQDDRTLLAQLAGLPTFAPAHRFLSRFRFYSPAPGVMRDFAFPGADKVLRSDGSNAADIVTRMAQAHPELMERVNGYLHTFNPDFTSLRPAEMGGLRYLLFDPELGSGRAIFRNAEVSDGTLRAVGILLALFQSRSTPESVTLVGLEEPETNLHPGAAGVLLDALIEASDDVQVVASTHSADLLDRKDVAVESLLAFAMQDGQTVIGPIDSAGRDVIRRRLSTAGDLLRNDRLSPAVA